jgi:hypothetical protein
MNAMPMSLLDLLDREAARFDADFRRCAAAPDGNRRRTLCRALLQRVAAYLLALDQVVYPALAALQLPCHDATLALHDALKARVADALLASCGPPARAWRDLCRVHLALARQVRFMRRELYPPVLAGLTAPESSLVGEELLHWLGGNRREDGRESPPARQRRGRPGLRPSGADLLRVPTLHHVVAASHPADKRWSGA